MADSLIVVESPTKVKTLKKYLGPEYEVRASVGHIMDLPKSKLGIDIEADFKPSYEVLKDKIKTINELKKAARQVRNVYLAPDPDREGEAIAWHIAREIESDDITIFRVLFNDLTKQTVLAAIKSPRRLDFDKFEAQQTRRILDRLVGYQISPLLWEKVRRGLSAGRVQSVAVRIICDREEEINSFVSEEYWNITAHLESGTPPPFTARLIRIGKKKARIENGEEARALLASLKMLPFVVASMEQKEVKRTPPPPFTTSKLQQEASRRLRFPAKKTMRTAQKLYEGIEIGNEGSVGLITYMRTDSVRIAPEALTEARAYIEETYGAPFLPPKARLFKTSKTAQDAHEAIRPASLAYRPDDIKSFLSRDEFRLYQLIWNRFVASQMNPAILDQTTIDIDAGECRFRAQGSVMKFPGFTVLYSESRDDDEQERESEGLLPPVSKGETLSLRDLDGEQHFTQPPPRFSEATLVKELEEKGLGRPSTYAAILSTIQDREYVKLEKGRFHPTELGIVVNELLVVNFPHILDASFTAAMENKLDRIETGALSRLETLREFYDSFRQELETAREKMRNVKREEVSTDIVCEECGKPMVIKWGKKGRFLACTNYPECKNTKNFTQDEGGDIRPEEKKTDIPCPLCGKPMLLRQGRFGKFLGCTGYPECTQTMDVAPDGTPVAPSTDREPSETLCEKCGKPMRVKRGRYGRFLGCSGYPECKNIVPVPREGKTGETTAVTETTDVLCNKCGKPMTVKRGRYGRFLGCSGYPECKNIMKYKAPAHKGDDSAPQDS